MMYSVIIPAYNCEKTISKVLESVLNQTCFDLIEEIIVINDGSTDSTEKEILDFIRNNPDKSIRYLSQDNHGVSYTRNRGIKIAKSEWIALLDSDDVWLPRKIEIQTQYINETPGMCFLGSAYPLKVGIHTVSGLYKLSAKELCIRSTPTTPSVVFNRAVGMELGLFKENMSYCEDINFFQKFLLKDSYYVLGADLVKIGIEKNYFGQSGQSSNIKEMAYGFRSNLKELYDLKLISKTYWILMVVYSYLKYIRRKVIVFVHRKFNI